VGCRSSEKTRSKRSHGFKKQKKGEGLDGQTLPKRGAPEWRIITEEKKDAEGSSPSWN